MSEKYSRFLLEYRSLTLRNLNNHGFKLICNVQFNFSLLKGSCIFFPAQDAPVSPAPKSAVRYIVILFHVVVRVF